MQYNVYSVLLLLSHQVEGGRAERSAAGQTADLPGWTSPSPEHKADATEPSGPDDCPAQESFGLIQIEVRLLQGLSC